MISTCVWLFSVCCALVESRTHERLTKAIKVNELIANMEILQNISGPLRICSNFPRLGAKNGAHFKLVPYFPEISLFSPCWFAWIFSSVGQLCFVKHAVTDRVRFCLCRESRHFLPYKQKRTFRAMLTPVCLTQCGTVHAELWKYRRLKMTECLCGLGPWK